MSPRLAAVGLTTQARDPFKDIDYLLAPAAGLGYKVVVTGRTEWTTDGSMGLALEKNTNRDLNTDQARPASPLLKKSDQSIVLSVVYKY